MLEGQQLTDYSPHEALEAVVLYLQEASGVDVVRTLTGETAEHVAAVMACTGVRKEGVDLLKTVIGDTWNSAGRAGQVRLIAAALSKYGERVKADGSLAARISMLKNTGDLRDAAKDNASKSLPVEEALARLDTSEPLYCIQQEADGVLKKAPIKRRDALELVTRYGARDSGGVGNALGCGLAVRLPDGDVVFLPTKSQAKRGEVPSAAANQTS